MTVEKKKPGEEDEETYAGGTTAPVDGGDNPIPNPPPTKPPA